MRRFLMLILLAGTAVLSTACHYHVSDAQVLACEGDNSLHFSVATGDTCADVTPLRKQLGF